MADKQSPKSKSRSPKRTRAVQGGTSRSRVPKAGSEEEKGKPWTFPKHTLDEAIGVAKAIEEKNAGNPMRADMLARAVGYSQPGWRFLDLVRSARMYGLVSFTGVNTPIELGKIGRDIVAPSSPQQRQNALRLGIPQR